MAVTALLTLLVAAYVVGFVLGWGDADARAKLTYALYLPLTFGPMVLAWRVAGRRSLPLATRLAWRRIGVGLAGWFLANVGGGPVQAGTAVLALTLSLGVADSTGCRGLDALLHHADMALYEAKRRGRDQAAVWSAVTAPSGQGSGRRR